MRTKTILKNLGIISGAAIAGVLTASWVNKPADIQTESSVIAEQVAEADDSTSWYRYVEETDKAVTSEAANEETTERESETTKKQDSEANKEKQTLNDAAKVSEDGTEQREDETYIPMSGAVKGEAETYEMISYQNDEITVGNYCEPTSENNYYWTYSEQTEEYYNNGDQQQDIYEETYPADIGVIVLE